jgi:hypothetical protein
LATLAAVAATALTTVFSGFAASGLDWVIGYEVASGIAAGLLGIGALAVGTIAARRRRGRGFGIAGAVLGGVTLFIELALVVLALVFAVGAIA